MSSRDIYDACQHGDIEQLETWKAEGKLPDLMDEFDTKSQWFPHEIAIRHDNLDVLKWLVNDSGQKIDLTVSGQRSLINAVAYARTEIMRWLVLESKQPVLVRLDENDTDWYKSDHYNNDEITTFLEAVNNLHVAGVTIDQIQQTPEMAKLVESGLLSAELVARLDENDIKLATGASTATTARKTRRF